MLNSRFVPRYCLVALVLAATLLCGLSLPAMASAEGSFQRTLQVSGPVNLDVSTGSGEIQVRSGPSGEVQVSARIKVSNWFGSDADERIRRIEANPPIQQSGNDIRIGHIDDPELRHNVSISYELVVPADTELRTHSGSGAQKVEGISGSVEVDAGSGAISISDINSRVRAETGSGTIAIDRINGNVHAKTGSGDIRATGIAGGFEGHSGSGHIELTQTAPGSVNVETGSGGIDARGIHGSLDATAGSGNIRAEGEPSGGWTVHTGSGSVRLKLASNAAFDLDARTSSGSISVAQPVTVQGQIGHKELHGRVNGGGVPINIRTASGNIDVE